MMNSAEVKIETFTQQLIDDIELIKTDLTYTSMSSGDQAALYSKLDELCQKYGVILEGSVRDQMIQYDEWKSFHDRVINSTPIRKSTGIIRTCGDLGD